LDIAAQVDAFVDASNNAKRDHHSEVLQLFLSMLDHVVKSNYKLQFHPCDDEKCKYDCVSRKKRPSESFTRALNALGGRLPGAYPSPTLLDHNATLFDFLLNPELGGEFRGCDDSHMPKPVVDEEQVPSGLAGKCEMGGTNTMKAEKDARIGCSSRGVRKKPQKSRTFTQKS
jgi:hypothetical protein